MKYTKKERLKIYAQVLDTIQKNLHMFGICYELQRVCGRYRESEIFELFPEFEEHKPANYTSGEYWFPHTAEGNKERIKLLQKILT